MLLLRPGEEEAGEGSRKVIVPAPLVCKKSNQIMRYAVSKGWTGRVVLLKYNGDGLNSGVTLAIYTGVRATAFDEEAFATGEAKNSRSLAACERMRLLAGGGKERLKQ
jgi:hypothetical protein